MEKELLDKELTRNLNTIIKKTIVISKIRLKCHKPKIKYAKTTIASDKLDLSWKQKIE